ncbi:MULTISPECIES: hypothetical protein [Thiohalobacter]|uniref:hypothetical protein n=1 Tax=Thiohalobacter TaxID=1273155 RepID=UPI0012FD7B52|nr:MULTISPECIES: hypothetical protein [Thiohalobacter]
MKPGRKKRSDIDVLAAKSWLHALASASDAIGCEYHRRPGVNSRGINGITNFCSEALDVLVQPIAISMYQHGKRSPGPDTVAAIDKGLRRRKYSMIADLLKVGPQSEVGVAIPLWPALRRNTKAIEAGWRRWLNSQEPAHPGHDLLHMLRSEYGRHWSTVDALIRIAGGSGFQTLVRVAAALSLAALRAEPVEKLEEQTPERHWLSRYGIIRPVADGALMSAGIALDDLERAAINAGLLSAPDIPARPGHDDYADMKVAWEEVENEIMARASGLRFESF